jgi:uncharacterized protein (TIGR03067 family)
MRFRVLAVVAVVGLCLAADAKDDAAKKEMDKLKGTWAMTAGEGNGDPLPPEMVKSAKLIVMGDKITLNDGNEKHEATYKVDPTQKPTTIDITPTDGPEKGKVMKGIYMLDGDTLKMCLGEAGKDRPAEMASKKGSNSFCVSFKREKP